MRRSYLSRDMRDALAAMKREGRLVRHPGGFWAPPSAGMTSGGWPHPHFGTSTVEALVRRKRAVYSQWKQGRRGRFPVEARPAPEASAAAA